MKLRDLGFRVFQGCDCRMKNVWVGVGVLIGMVFAGPGVLSERERFYIWLESKVLIALLTGQ